MQCLDHPRYGRVAEELNKWRCFWINFLFTFVYYLFLGVGGEHALMEVRRQVASQFSSLATPVPGN